MFLRNEFWDQELHAESSLGNLERHTYEGVRDRTRRRDRWTNDTFAIEDSVYFMGSSGDGMALQNCRGPGFCIPTLASQRLHGRPPLAGDGRISFVRWFPRVSPNEKCTFEPLASGGPCSWGMMVLTLRRGTGWRTSVPIILFRMTSLWPTGALHGGSHLLTWPTCFA